MLIGWLMMSEGYLQVFTEDLGEVEHLPRDEVLQFLLTWNKNGDLVIPYLVSVVMYLPLALHSVSHTYLLSMFSILLMLLFIFLHLFYSYAPFMFASHSVYA